MDNSNFLSSVKTIMIFGAMDAETNHLASRLSDIEKIEIGGYPFTIGNYSGKKIIVCKTFTGMENSAAATAIGILKFSPDCIISQGTAGGHEPQLHKNDIVAGERLLNVSSIKTKRHSKNEGIHPEEWEIKDWDSIENDEKKLPCLYSNRSLVNLAMSTEYKKGRLVRGTISSSNNWNMELDRINFFVKSYGSTCEEMESYAATLIAGKFNIPCVTVRIISNSEQHPGEEYDRRTGSTCQEFVLDMIKNMSA